ncbi:MAG: RnfH family protein [Gammaproteobacteria bacterium]|nr:MAG: RnfH family protein [Gammaproteobacteria bacterium]
MHLEVAYATPERQAIISVEVAAGTTLIEAVKQSDIGYLFPELDLDQADMGIWSKPHPKDTPVKDGQRIEIYRPLLADPKQARRNRAEKRPLKKRPPKK